MSSNKIKQIQNNKIEQIVSKKVDVSKTIEQKTRKIIKAGTNKNFLTFLDNTLSESILLATQFGINTAKQVSISATDKSTDANHTRM